MSVMLTRSRQAALAMARALYGRVGRLVSWLEAPLAEPAHDHAAHARTGAMSLEPVRTDALGGPPAHWLALVSRHAPQLLTPRASLGGKMEQHPFPGQPFPGQLPNAGDSSALPPARSEETAAGNASTAEPPWSPGGRVASRVADAPRASIPASGSLVRPGMVDATVTVGHVRAEPAAASPVGGMPEAATKPSTAAAEGQGVTESGAAVRSVVGAALEESGTAALAKAPCGSVDEGARDAGPSPALAPTAQAAVHKATPWETPLPFIGTDVPWLDPATTPTSRQYGQPEGRERPAAAVPAPPPLIFEPASVPCALDGDGDRDVFFEAALRWPALPGEPELSIRPEVAQAGSQPWPVLPGEPVAPALPERWSASRRARLDSEQRGQRWNG